MKFTKNIKKLLTCSIVLSGLLGIGAIGTNANHVHASTINRAGIFNIMNKNDPDPSPAEIKKGQEQSDNAGKVSKKQIKRNFKMTQKMVARNNNTPVSHKSHKHVAKRYVRKHITKRSHKRVRKVATKRTKLTKRSIRKITNRIKHDKKLINRKHGRKATKRYAKRDLKKQLRALKKAKKMLAKSYKRVHYTKRARK